MNRVELGEGSSLSGSHSGEHIQSENTPHFSSFCENHERWTELQQMGVHGHRRVKLPVRRKTLPGSPGQLTDTVRPYVLSKAPRMHWTPDLHRRFLHAVDILGGEDRATPKKILQIMNVEGVTMKHITSHLQRYRDMKVEELMQARVMANEKGKHSLHSNDTFVPESTNSSVIGPTRPEVTRAIDPTRPPALNSSSSASYSQRLRPSEAGSGSSTNDVSLDLTLG